MQYSFSSISFLLLLFLSAILRAQEGHDVAAPGTFGCGSREQPVRTDFLRNPPQKFSQVTAPAGYDQWMHRSFKDFDTKKYGFSAVEFFIHPVKTNGYSGAWGDDESKITAMELYLRLRAPSGSERWYLLQDTDQPSQGESLLFVQPDRNDDALEEPTGDNKPKQSRDPLDEWMTLGTATPDPHLPLFAITDGYNDHGANAGGTIGNNLLIDLISGAPVLRAGAQCIEWEGGGACGAPDTSNMHWDATYCTWQQKLEDFLCTTTGAFGGSYNSVNAKTEFLLLSGASHDSLSWAPDALPSLEAFVKKFAEAGHGRALVKDLGYVDLIWSSESPGPTKKLLLLASPGAGEYDNARFRVVTWATTARCLSLLFLNGRLAAKRTMTTKPRLGTRRAMTTSG